jgi:LysM repeat protein
VVGNVEQASTEDKSKLSSPYPFPPVTFGQDEAKVTLVYRNTPFDKENWLRIKQHILPSEYVIDEQLSRSDNDHYNIFWAGTSVSVISNQFQLKKIAPALINSKDVKRYGLSPLEIEIQGFAQDNNLTVNALETVSRQFTRRLKAWFENNHNYFSGTLRVHGEGKYRVGQRLLYDEREYYIESVSHSFVVLNDWTTTLTVSRGDSVSEYKANTFASSTIVGSSNKSSTIQSSVNNNGSEAGIYHKVVSGDSLWNIAKKYYGDGEEYIKIYEANKQTLIARDSRNEKEKGKYIYIGQVLFVPLT